MKDCKLCGEPTDNVFNVRFAMVPICERCATDITMQQVQWWGAKLNVAENTQTAQGEHTDE